MLQKQLFNNFSKLLDGFNRLGIGGDKNLTASITNEELF